jgi:protoporphyrinogen/coproporphyrinogen III oxidase
MRIFCWPGCWLSLSKRKIKMKNHPVIIIGGGITGLSAAWYLEQKGFTDITILEAGNRPGGKIETRLENGFMVEKGPDSFVVTKPFATDLVHELGMDDELIAPKTNRFMILKNGELAGTPKGLNMMVPTDPIAFLESKFFSWPAKHRILEESTIQANQSNEDESFADFMIRRFGQEMLDSYAGPLFTGIYATPAHELSLNATFPMLKSMEQNFGSITRAIKKQIKTQPAAATGSSRSTFLSLKRGIQSLTETLISKLKHTTIHVNSSVESLEKINGNYEIYTKHQEHYTAGNVIVTLPAPQAKKLLHSMAPETAAILSGFGSSSSRVVTLAYPKDAVRDPLLSTGYVSAANEKNLVNAGSWITSKWDNRAPEGYVLLRCFIGKSREAMSFSNDALIHAAHLEMSKLLGITEEPEYYWVERIDDALPQYKVGHLDKVNDLLKSIESFEGLYVTGSYLYGVGLPDCIKQGKDAAAALENVDLAVSGKS